MGLFSYRKHSVKITIHRRAGYHDSVSERLITNDILPPKKNIISFRAKIITHNQEN